ncbi:MAG: DUF2344 domain-containing protein [Clostridia bacterium]|nr:DUF2344 domain-containing protein [Clostridia bacterium]
MKGNYTYRLLYEKGVNVRYISQLDFVRVLNRTVRRSGLPVTYTVGFNPHPVMTVAAPIPVGTTSVYECIDIDFDEKQDTAFLAKHLDATFPEGIRVLEAKEVTQASVPFRDIDSASYTVRAEYSGAAPDVNAFLALGEILIEKKTKKGLKEIDIKPDIEKLVLLSAEDGICIFEMQLPCGNEKNIKPDLVVQAIEKYQPQFHAECVLPHRTAVYAKGKLIF